MKNSRSYLALLLLLLLWTDHEKVHDRQHDEQRQHHARAGALLLLGRTARRGFVARCLRRALALAWAFCRAFVDHLLTTGSLIASSLRLAHLEPAVADHQDERGGSA